MKVKKIVMVVNVAWSMFNFRHGLISQLLQDGYQLTIISKADDFSDELRKMGCEVIDINLSSKGTNPIEDFKLIFALYKHYKKIKPDFIIHYSIKPNVYGSIAAKLACIPSLAITTGLGYTFVNNNFVAKVARVLYKIALRFPEEVWFLNEDDRQVFFEYRLVSPGKAKLLHSEGINLIHFTPQENSNYKNNAQSTICFLLIARMLWDKGIGEFVEAARLVKSKYPDKNGHPIVEFQLLGDCGVDNPSMIELVQIEKWERQGIVKYLGTTSDVRQIIANADCVVLPSYREGVPRSMMESAAMAKPLIVSDVPGCRDVVIAGNTGLLCSVKDAESLAECCEEFIGMSVEERAIMGLNGRNLMAQKFDEKLIISQYMQTLKKYSV